MKDIDKKLIETINRYAASGIEQQVDYEKFYLYSLITHSTAIEGSTVTEVENQLLFDEGIVAKGRSLVEQMMNVDLKNAYLFGFEWVKTSKPYTVDFLCELSAKVMRRMDSEYSTLGGNFDSSKGELRRCNVSAGIGGRSYMAFQKVPQATADFCQWLNDALASVDKNNAAACYRLSFEAHFRLVTIHSWVDGNGRTTRLLMNIIQRQLGLIPSIVIVTKDAKGEYIQALIDSREQEDSTIIQDVMLAQHITNLESRVLQYQQSINDTVNDESDTVNDTAMRFIALIKAHPEYTYDEYAKTLDIGRAIVARHIKKLNGTIIKRIGSDKDGHWEIITNITNGQ
ncbi:filamentation induced by cAMP protein fic [Mediterranea sp. An20]|uniref:Fic family protein n=1 Tax=Mediterranea sp. An20 TaxID=1965586 RepID=UPI000B3A9CEB|nr:Fic family protein [Mediterranea sp. An20]OUP10666.1 filamentation induced by cAMP protein fic [Mediterranea sp. An20]